MYMAQRGRPIHCSPFLVLPREQLRAGHLCLHSVPLDLYRPAGQDESPSNTTIDISCSGTGDKLSNPLLTFLLGLLGKPVMGRGPVSPTEKLRLMRSCSGIDSFAGDRLQEGVGTSDERRGKDEWR